MERTCVTQRKRRDLIQGDSDGKVVCKESSASSWRKGVFSGNCFACNQPGHPLREWPLRGEKQKAGERRGIPQESRKSSGLGVPNSISLRPLVARSPEKEVIEVGATDGKGKMLSCLNEERSNWSEASSGGYRAYCFRVEA